jgi:serine/threonine-protein kinase HipA
MSVAPYFRISSRRAKAILRQVETAVKGWRQAGRALGMSKAQLDAFADAFEHSERRAAARA